MHPAAPPVREKSSLADTPEGREAISRQLEKVLTSSVFRSSKRYPALLRYIVEQTLEGREPAIKERILGVEVFGRSPDYDTNTDHVVRTAAGEVRKRLAQYYMEPGREQELRIEVPAGSYVPQFRSAPEPTALAPDRPVTAPPATSWKSRTRTFLIASVIVNVAFAFFVAEQGNIGTMMRGESMLQKFWAPLLQTGEPVLLCVGTRDGFPNGQTSGTAANMNPSNQDPLMRRVAMADVLTLARVSAYIGSQRIPYRILNPASTTFTDLSSGPAVLIGAGNNAWARQLTDNLRFSITTADPNAPENVRPTGIRDSQHPENHQWTTVQSLEPAVYKEYGLISRLLNPRVEQVIVVIGSLGTHATEAAGEFVTDPAQLKKLEAFAPAGWGKKNVQVVISAEIVRGKAGPPKVEAVWFW